MADIKLRKYFVYDEDHQPIGSGKVRGKIMVGDSCRIKGVEYEVVGFLRDEFSGLEETDAHTNNLVVRRRSSS